MSKIEIGLLLSMIFAMVCCAVFKASNFEMILFLMMMYSAILFMDFLCVEAINRISRKISPYLVFAVADFLIGAGIAIFSIYDMKVHADEWLGGLVGAVLLVYIIPFTILLLIIDLMIWRKSKSKQ